MKETTDERSQIKISFYVVILNAVKNLGNIS